MPENAVFPIDLQTLLLPSMFRATEIRSTFHHRDRLLWEALAFRM